MTPRQKATELIKHFTTCQVRTTKSKQEAIASSIMFIELLINYNQVKDVDYWLNVKEALINTN